MIKIKKIHEDAIIPKRANLSDSGLDLYSVEEKILPSYTPTLFKTGWQMSVPEGYEIQIRSRSGNALKKNVTVHNSPGTVDSSYRGEVGVILFNSSDKDIIIKKGDKIAQAVIASVSLWNPIIVDNLEETNRGSGGFGSTDS